ncbi:MAG: mechanosensitive ion channel family protein [Pseudomonadota bacterium]|mgnify:CR=1 FL=1
MDVNSLAEILHIGGMLLGVSIVLGSLLLVVHFFTRHMKNIIYRMVVACGLISLIGISWHIFHPLIHPELKKIDFYISSLIWILALFGVAYLVNKLIDKYVWNQIFIDLEKKQTLSTSFLRSVVAGLVYLIFVLLIMWIVFNKEVRHLEALLAGSTVLLGYAGSDIIKELFAGLALNLNPAFKKGDFLKIDDHQAKIVDIDWRYVILEDITANLMFVPNTKMLHHTIYKYGGDTNKTRIKLPFHIHPNVPPQLVFDILMPQLKQLPYLAEKDWFQDNVVIHVKNCDGHSMEFAVEILVDCFENFYEIQTIAYKIIWYTLNYHDIPMFAYRMRVDLPTEGYMKMRQLWNPTVSKKELAALLKASFLFSLCSRNEIELLSNHAALHQFAPYQHLFSEGDTGDVLFLLKTGTVQLTKKMPSGDVLVTKILEPSDAVGVNAVITGKKRERSAVAVTHVQAYMIKRDILKKIVDKYHERVQHMADQIVFEEELQQQDFKIYLAKKTREKQKMRGSIIGQIREFLGISNASDL